MKKRTLTMLLQTVLLIAIMTVATACKEEVPELPVVEEETEKPEVEENHSPNVLVESEPINEKDEITQDEQDYEDALEEENAKKIDEEAEFTVTPFQQTMYATSSVNVRIGPSADYKKVSQLHTGDEILTTGKVDEVDWYEFELENGNKVYVSGSYLSEIKPEEKVVNSEGFSQSELDAWMAKYASGGENGSASSSNDGFVEGGGSYEQPVNDGSLDYLPPAH